MIISAGFRVKRAGDGLELERQVLEAAREGGYPPHRPELSRRDVSGDGIERNIRGQRWQGQATLRLISQSGAICAALLDWSLREQVGFSAFHVDRVNARCWMGLR